MQQVAEGELPAFLSGSGSEETVSDGLSGSGKRSLSGKAVAV